MNYSTLLVLIMLVAGACIFSGCTQEVQETPPSGPQEVTIGFYELSGDYSFWYDPVSDKIIQAQKFEIERELTVDSVEVYLKRITEGETDVNVQMDIYSNANGMPGNKLAGSTIPLDSIGGEFAWEKIQMEETLSAGEYWLVLSLDGVVGWGPSWRRADEPAYKGPKDTAVSGIDGEEWQYKEVDFLFRIKGHTTAEED